MYLPPFDVGAGFAPPIPMLAPHADEGFRPHRSGRVNKELSLSDSDKNTEL